MARLTPLAGALAVLFLAGFAAGCLHDPVAVRMEQRRDAFDALTRGQDLLREGDLILARDSFLRGIDLSDRPVLQYQVAHSYYRLGQYEQALPWYDRAIEMAPDYQLARTERELAIVRVARELDEPLPTGPQGDGMEEDDEVEVAREANDDEAAAPAQTTPPAATRPSRDRMGGAGRALSMMTGREGAVYDDSLTDVAPEELRALLFPELVEGADADIEALRASAREAERTGRMDEATRFWNRILEADPTNLDARLGYSWSLFKGGRSRAALEEYRRTQRLHPHEPRLYYEWGNFHAESGEYSDATTRYRRSIELDPDQERAWNNLGVVLLRQDRFRDALDAFEEATRHNPAFAPPWLNKAIALEGTGAGPSELLETLEHYMRLHNQPDAPTERWIRELRREGGVAPTTDPPIDIEALQ